MPLWSQFTAIALDPDAHVWTRFCQSAFRQLAQAEKRVRIFCRPQPVASGIALLGPEKGTVTVTCD